MVGVATVKADNPSLTTRLEDRQGCDPTRIILDTHLSIPLNARVLTQSSTAKTILATGPEVSAARRRRVEAAGAEVLPLPCRDDRVDLALLMRNLGNRGIASILIEGGSRVSGSVLRAGLADKLYLFYAPKLMGGDDGIPICRGPGPERMQDCLGVDRVSVRRFGEDVMIEGYLENTATRH